MPKKHYTFLLVAPHGKLRRVSIPAYTLQLALVLAVTGIVGITALANSYARMLLKVSQYNNLRLESEALKTQNRTLKSTVDHANKKLVSLESLASEVALAYGFGRRQIHFPQAVFSLAAQSNATVESSYNASLYAFNLIEKTAFNPATSPLARGLLHTPRFDPASMPSLWPVRGQVTAGFGERMDPFSGEDAFHAGLDIAAPKGTSVEATGDGIVLSAGRAQAGYGNEVIIDHGSGITTTYGHLSKIFVVAGQEVEKGEVIGAVGMTGRTTGPHLHYEVRVHQTPVNPAKFLKG
jgi:murein DD-endopeptidase MepM/ murein hydrolase activator NlpD